MAKRASPHGRFETGCCIWRLRRRLRLGPSEWRHGQVWKRASTTAVVFRLDKALGHTVFRGAMLVVTVVADKPRAEQAINVSPPWFTERQKVIGQFRRCPCGLDHEGSIPRSCRGTSSSCAPPFPPGISPKRLHVAKRIRVQRHSQERAEWLAPRSTSIVDPRVNRRNATRGSEGVVVECRIA